MVRNSSSSLSLPPFPFSLQTLHLWVSHKTYYSPSRFAVKLFSKGEGKITAVPKKEREISLTHVVSWFLLHVSLPHCSTPSLLFPCATHLWTFPIYGNARECSADSAQRVFPNKKGRVVATLLNSNLWRALYVRKLFAIREIQISPRRKISQKISSFLYFEKRKKKVREKVGCCRKKFRRGREKLCTRELHSGKIFPPPDDLIRKNLTFPKTKRRKNKYLCLSSAPSSSCEGKSKNFPPLLKRKCFLKTLKLQTGSLKIVEKHGI